MISSILISALLFTIPVQAASTPAPYSKKLGENCDTYSDCASGGLCSGLLGICLTPQMIMARKRESFNGEVDFVINVPGLVYKGDKCRHAARVGLSRMLQVLSPAPPLPLGFDRFEMQNKQPGESCTTYTECGHKRSYCCSKTLGVCISHKLWSDRRAIPSLQESCVRMSSVSYSGNECRPEALDTLKRLVFPQVQY